MQAGGSRVRSGRLFWAEVWTERSSASQRGRCRGWLGEICFFFGARGGERGLVILFVFFFFCGAGGEGGFVGCGWGGGKGRIYVAAWVVVEVALGGEGEGEGAGDFLGGG